MQIDFFKETFKTRKKIQKWIGDDEMKKGSIVFGVGIILITLLFSGCTDVSEDFIQFSIVSFNVEPTMIDEGEAVNLSWIVIGGVSVSIDNGIGTVSLTGTRIITPTTTTTYTLTASNSTTTLTATTQVIVREESP